MPHSYWIRWLTGYGWAVWYGADPRRLYPISGWRGADLNHVLTWCGSVPVTILPPEGRV